MSFRPRTILRLRSRTSAMLIAKPSCVMPNSLLRRKYEATFALWMMFLLGKHAMFGHDPPRYWRSMTATRCPCPANVQAAMVDPVPAILGEWLVILMNVSSPIAFRFRRYIGRQQQALSQRFSILRPPLFPRPYLLRAGCG